MNEAPKPIMKATLRTLKWAMVYCRNYTQSKKPNLNQINELMEAIHDIPDQLYRWNDDSMDRLKLHLRCFDSNKWNDSPNLLIYFENELERYS